MDAVDLALVRSLLRLKGTLLQPWGEAKPALPGSETPEMECIPVNAPDLHPPVWAGTVVCTHLGE